MTKDEALKQRLGMAQPNRGSVGFQEALAQPEQPKVRTGNCLRVGVCASEGHKIQPQCKPLTDDEILSISADCASSHQHMDIHFARAIEDKLRSKNHEI